LLLGMLFLLCLTLLLLGIQLFFLNLGSCLHRLVPEFLAEILHVKTVSVVFVVPIHELLDGVCINYAHIMIGFRSNHVIVGLAANRLHVLDVLDNKTPENVAFTGMGSSCKKVSRAVIQGSDGDRLKVIEYMKSVCSESNYDMIAAKSNHDMCIVYANAIQEFMDGDNEYNRNSLDMENFCQKFWDKSV
jgi:hypothetical protein